MTISQQADINFSSASGRSYSNILASRAVFENLRQNKEYLKFLTQTHKFQSGPRKIYSMASQGREAPCLI